MKKDLLKKIIELFFTIIFVSFFLFSSLYLLKGNSASFILSEEMEERYVEEYLKERDSSSFFISYIKTLCNFFTFKWGKSISGESVVSIVKTSLPVTLSLSIYSFVFSFPFSLFLSIKAVNKKGGFYDRMLSLLSSLFLAFPSFFSSIILILIFSLIFHLFPVAGYFPFSKGFFNNFKSLFLPSLSLSFISSSFMMRIFREALRESSEQPYITYERAKGAKEKTIVEKYALKPSLGIIIPALSQSLISFFSSSVIVENVFALPGLGRALVKSSLERDYSVSFTLVMIIVLFISFLLFLSSFFVNQIDTRRVDE